MEHPAGVSSGCIECRKILRTGTWLVGIIVGAQEEYKYLVGANPPVMCCGQEKQVIETFDTEEEANAFSKKIAEQIDREGTTKNLVLYEAHPVLSSAKH